jgi:hypothetical protein|tara:strand:- start:538 stop:690 length:153 start_codon:yes stop_codon:yes gene_type:complete
MFKMPKIKMPKVKVPNVLGKAKDLGKNISKEVGGKVKDAGKGIKKLNPFK